MAKKIQVTLNPDLEKWLILWAYLRESNLQQWLKVVLRLRVNNHKEELIKELDQRAESMGVDRDELIEAILKQAQFDFDGLTEDLNITKN